MLVEERLDRGLHLVRAEPRAAVARPGDLVESDLDPRSLQRLVEQFALVAGHEGVLLAVRDEERRRVLRHVSDGVGAIDLLDVFWRRRDIDPPWITKAWRPYPINSSPVRVPVLLPNLFTSRPRPRRWSIET